MCVILLSSLQELFRNSDVAILPRSQKLLCYRVVIFFLIPPSGDKERSSKEKREEREKTLRLSNRALVLRYKQQLLL